MALRLEQKNEIEFEPRKSKHKGHIWSQVKTHCPLRDTRWIFDAAVCIVSTTAFPAPVTTSASSMDPNSRMLRSRRFQICMAQVLQNTERNSLVDVTVLLITRALSEYCQLH